VPQLQRCVCICRSIGIYACIYRVPAAPYHVSLAMPLELRIAYPEARRAKAARQRAAIAAVRIYTTAYVCIYVYIPPPPLPRDAAGSVNCVYTSKAGQGCSKSAARRFCRGAYIYYCICLCICMYRVCTPPRYANSYASCTQKLDGPKRPEGRSAPLSPRCVYILLRMCVSIYVYLRYSSCYASGAANCLQRSLTGQR